MSLCCSIATLYNTVYVQNILIQRKRTSILAVFCRVFTFYINYVLCSNTMSPFRGKTNKRIGASASLSSSFSWLTISFPLSLWLGTFSTASLSLSRSRSLSASLLHPKDSSYSFTPKYIRIYYVPIVSINKNDEKRDENK